jgi:hypothetical protein
VPHNGHVRAGDIVFYNLTWTAIDGDQLDHT